MSTIYELNKGINRSVEFKGIKAQYIIYLAAGMVVLLLLFAVAYLIGTNIYVCVISVLIAGYALINSVQRYSKKYGEYGLVRKAAQARLPIYVTANSRKIFIMLTELKSDEEQETGGGFSNLQSGK
jgi:uncharacterized membrane protein YjjP (DUF1212 family)